MKTLILSAIVISMLNAGDYYKECDFNSDGKISGRLDWKAGLVDKETAKKETKCRHKYENKKLDKDI